MGWRTMTSGTVCLKVSTLCQFWRFFDFRNETSFVFERWMFVENRKYLAFCHMEQCILRCEFIVIAWMVICWIYVRAIPLIWQVDIKRNKVGDEGSLEFILKTYSVILMDINTIHSLSHGAIEPKQFHSRSLVQICLWHYLSANPRTKMFGYSIFWPVFFFFAVRHFSSEI